MDRNIETKRISWAKKAQRRPLLLGGVGQAGKTYGLKVFRGRHFESLHYSNFEEDILLRTTRILEARSFRGGHTIRPGRDLSTGSFLRGRVPVSVLSIDSKASRLFYPA